MNKLTKLNWYKNRLKAMSLSEVRWRLEQKSLCEIERIKFSAGKTKVIDNIYHLDLPDAEIETIPDNRFNTADANNIQIFVKSMDLSSEINWNEGFQTLNKWPDTFAYDLHYKQQEAIGDARTNWELNRLHFMPQIAKNYFCTGDIKYLKQFHKLFYDWIDKNKFLTGISWTSVMEVAIRAYQWYVSLAFIANSSWKESSEVLVRKLVKDLKTGILNMMEYVSRHYSRFSSANNHLIVEMAMLGIIGRAFGREKWVRLSLETLELEIKRQNHEDGVNKEQSIHYQSFVMEALALYLHTLEKYKIEHPQVFEETLKTMCEFVADLSDMNCEIAHIGDNDEGKLLDLSGGSGFNHYKYVLQLCSVILDVNYTDFLEPHENLKFLFDSEVITSPRPAYDNSISKAYIKGGHTILKYRDATRERIMTFDHAELGFGSIAAHGHADALGITLSVDGRQILIDPGTYIYHSELEWRDYFRKTTNHNTIAVENRDQSEMLGAFLWGRRAAAHVMKYDVGGIMDNVIAYHDGYNPIIHKREIRYYKPDLFILIDHLDNCKGESFTGTYCFDSSVSAEINHNTALLKVKDIKVYISSSEKLRLEECWISKTYSSKEKSKALKISGTAFNSKKIVTCISIGERHRTDKESVSFINRTYHI